MIDEKKLIYWIECHYNPYGKPDLGLDTSLKIIDFIENQMTKIEKCSDCSRRKFYQEGYRDGVNANPWISCDFLMPGVDGMYLITSKVLDKTEVQYVFYQRSVGFICNGKAIAWMPLPEPYRPEEVRKQTNADRIRSMTDEELADFIERFGTFNQPCNISKGKTLEWLQSEVEE